MISKTGKIIVGSALGVLSLVAIIFGLFKGISCLKDRMAYKKKGN
jgi:hypothetical protein